MHVPRVCTFAREIYVPVVYTLSMQVMWVHMYIIEGAFFFSAIFMYTCTCVLSFTLDVRMLSLKLTVSFICQQNSWWHHIILVQTIMADQMSMMFLFPAREVRQKGRSVGHSHNGSANCLDKRLMHCYSNRKKVCLENVEGSINADARHHLCTNNKSSHACPEHAFKVTLPLQ